MSAGLRVVHVVCTDNFAGTERYVRNSAIWQTRAGCRVTVIGGAESGMRSVLEAEGVAWLPGGSVPRALRSLRRAHRADVINTHLTTADMVGAVAGRMLHVPVVSTRHFAATRGSSAPARLVARGIESRIAAQVAISDFVAESIEGPSTTVLSGVEPVASPTASRRPIVLVAQRFEAEKRTAVALEAWARVQASGHRGWRLQLAGAGAERDELAARARRLGIDDSVDFLGHRGDIDALFQTASILLATAPSEPFGLSVLEAMSHGLPIVAAAGGGHLETVWGTPGAALFEPGDADDAARQILRLIDDPAGRGAYGDALRDRQRNLFTAVRQTEATLGLYAAVAGVAR